MEFKDFTSRQKRRILEEFVELKRNIDFEWVVESYYPNDLGRLRLYLNGRAGSPYENGKFQLSVTFPDGYPFQYSHFRFDTRIFHPSVDVDGHMSLPFRHTYHSRMSICYLLHEITSAIYAPDTSDVLNADAAFLYDTNLEVYQRQVALWTSEYATEDEIISRYSRSTLSSGIVSKRACRN